MEQQELKLHGVRREIARADRVTGADAIKVPETQIDLKLVDDFVDADPDDPLVVEYLELAKAASETKKSLREILLAMVDLQNCLFALKFAKS